ncbi:hypothetical protein [Henriciella marina]|uniref:Uncharacterized protein n=1 Tax=Henriciella marina TaxID=453851 RepID=A0ABT4LXY1_9PROT|nr:hypothetical protein [Henriciella marina]MCZ4299225.1 hypothetical protein [Henriciella marina]
MAFSVDCYIFATQIGVGGLEDKFRVLISVFNFTKATLAVEHA